MATPASGAISLVTIRDQLEPGNSAYLNLASYRNRVYYINGGYSVRTITTQPDFAEFYNLWRPANQWILWQNGAGASGSFTIAHDITPMLHLSAGGGGGGNSLRSLYYSQVPRGGGAGGRYWNTSIGSQGGTYSWWVGGGGAGAPAAAGQQWGGNGGSSGFGSYQPSGGGGGSSTNACSQSGSVCAAGGGGGWPDGGAGGCASALQWDGESCYIYSGASGGSNGTGYGGGGAGPTPTFLTNKAGSPGGAGFCGIYVNG